MQPARSASRRRSWAAVHTSTRCAAAIRSRHLVCIGGIQVGKLAGGSSAISPVLSVHARAARSVTRQSVSRQFHGGTCRDEQLRPPLPKRGTRIPYSLSHPSARITSTVSPRLNSAGKSPTAL